MKITRRQLRKIISESIGNIPGNKVPKKIIAHFNAEEKEDIRYDQSFVHPLYNRKAVITQPSDEVLKKIENEIKAGVHSDIGAVTDNFIEREYIPSVSDLIGSNINFSYYPSAADHKNFSIESIQFLGDKADQ